MMTNINIMEHILKRRSIRNYLPQEVEREKILLLLQAAMAAPTACNSRPWEFIVVTDKAMLGQLRQNLYTGNYNAPAAIVVCGNPKIANNVASEMYWVQDCSAATENILIAAPGLGLGAVWVGVYPLPGIVECIAKILAIPEGVTPLCVVYVGYPAEKKPPRTQYDAHRVHWQQYEPRESRAKGKNA